MQRLAALRRLLASSAAIILPENDQPTRIHSYARADSVPIRLHAHELHFDEMFAIPIVLVKDIGISEAYGPCAGSRDKQVEKSVVIVKAAKHGPSICCRVDTG